MLTKASVFLRLWPADYSEALTRIGWTAWRSHVQNIAIDMNTACCVLRYCRYIIWYILGRNGIYFTWAAASYRGEARGLWINASPRERSLVKFHLSKFRIWKGFSTWGNRGSVACHLLRMKTSATYPQPQVAFQHLDGTWTRRPSPLPTAMLLWYGEQPRGITPLAKSRGRTQDLPRGKPVTYH